MLPSFFGFAFHIAAFGPLPKNAAPILGGPLEIVSDELLQQPFLRSIFFYR